MAWNFTSEQIDQLEAIMNAAEPYPEDDPCLDVYDDPNHDSDRMMATIAKRMLAEDKEEKKKAKT